MKSVVFWVLFGAFAIALASAEVIENRPCETGRDADIFSETSEISVDPCPEGPNFEPCTLYRGSNATVTIKFTPTISPAKRNKLKSSIAWVSSYGEQSFPGMKLDACKHYVDCPLKANEENVFSATLELKGETPLPTGLYDLKVKIEEFRGQKRVLACQLLTIQLSDPVEEEAEE